MSSHAAIEAQIDTLQAQLSPQGWVPIPGVAKAVVSSRLNGKVTQNVMHVLAAAPASQVEFQTIADALADAWFTGVYPFLHPQAVLVGVSLSDASSQSGPAAISTHHTGAVGGSGDPSPMAARSLAAVVSLHTGLAGKTHRGRLFISGFPRGFFNDESSGALNAGFVGGMNTAFQQIQTSLSAVQSGIVIASRVTNPGTSQLVTNASCSSQCGTQRRRLRP